jgi:UDP-N-acetylglucosamine 1-carboxyvinyltransferase
MPYIVVEGGKKLQGELRVHAAKNSAVALLCASLLIKGTTVLTEVPEIEEVTRIVDLLTSIGVSIKKKSSGTLVITPPKKLVMEEIDRKACEARSSLLLFGALAAREKKYKLYKTGGCKLGNRTVRPHVYALKKIRSERCF